MFWARTHFLRYRECRLSFSFSPELIFVGTDSVGSSFHVLRSRTGLRRFRGRRVQFSCFSRPNSFSAVPRASGPILMFCTLGLVFDGTEGVGSYFHVLRSSALFGWYRGRRVPFFMFCVPGLIFGGTDVVRSRFQVLRSRTRFRRCGGHWVSFSCFAIPDLFSTVPRASVNVFIFWSLTLVFGGIEGVGSRFHVLRSRTYFHRC
jgi:hypothetical protein